MYDYHCQATDGFGETDDKALERDRLQGVARDNRDREDVDRYQRVIDATSWGDKTCTPISNIVLTMMKDGISTMTMYKYDVYFDVEDIHEAVNKACIELGLSDEDFNAYLYSHDNEMTINL